MNGRSPGRRLWGGVLLACIVTTLVAVEMPVRLPEGSESRAQSDFLSDEAAEAAPEDLADFMASRRWGISLNEILEARSAPPEQDAPPPGQDERAINPVLAKMGYVGLIVANDRSAVLLASPEGGVARMALGDTLPDGRTLVSVTDNSLTLEGGGRVEVLTLFPRVGE